MILLDLKDHFNNLAKSNIEEFKKADYGSVDFSNYKKILDVGCGTGVLEQLLIQKYPHLDIYALDVSVEMLKIAKNKEIRNTSFSVGSITNIPYTNEEFDVVICIGVLQNFNGSPNIAINELRRVTRRGECYF